jgi:hypothetical protein
MSKLSNILLVAAIATAVASPAHALEWVCAGAKTNRLASVDLGPGVQSSAAMGAAPLTRASVISLYSGDRVRFQGEWMKVYMLPVDHPLTKQVFGRLGISPQTAIRRAAANSLVDSGLRIVSTPESMLLAMQHDRPSIGYVDFLPRTSYDISPCF